MAKQFRCPNHWTLQQRLEYWSIPDPASGCIICWATPRVRNYPSISWKHKNITAYRLAWQLYRGPIPAGMFVCHRCDFPPCVNVDHLFLGTNAENMADRDNKGRQAKGEHNGNAALTEEAVLEIFSYPASTRVTAKIFGISNQTVFRIRRKRTWKHIHILNQGGT